MFRRFFGVHFCIPRQTEFVSFRPRTRKDNTMLYKEKLQPIYCNLLGQTLSDILNKKQIQHNQIGYLDESDELDMIPETTIGQVLKGKRNLTSRTSLAFQEALELHCPKEVFFPSDVFKFELICQIVHLINTDESFNQTKLKKQLPSNLDNWLSQHQAELLTSLDSFISDFPDEETSYDMTQKIVDWISEFACLIAQKRFDNCQIF